jgi:1-acyl-sn-glycerol-3-phosphate acyltransferase
VASSPARLILHPGLALRLILHPPVAILARSLFDLRLEGTRHIPREGPTLLVANHQGYLDPIFLQMATTRTIRYMMTSDFYDVPFARPFFWLAQAIRIQEGGPYRDSIRKALAIIEQGGVVGIFPEGQLTLDGRVGAANPGALFLAAKSGAPVVPVRISGSYEAFRKGSRIPRQAQVRIRCGPPLFFTDARDRTAAERILEAVTAL